ncbi:hypothetical protein Acsp06_27060 [Actinomycetospora sp. NBRC 106375]|uniref:DUF2470 domain-containing protein n=1 Tax=Actinomycetospora sp. NBRC 106375 TaxID=3032207 RepID=UPI0024A42B9C|nr:DUF2470 domain-containing protein [Actinomycetospora sp. NBRC 106375]GLZ46521.1 hypothetical protein Acsp06_27060 [Actinomycetospora sp. NBRC 106375]
MARSRPPETSLPPVPPPAERARTLTGRARHAAVIGSSDPDGELRAAPTLHHVPATGAATLQFPEDHPLVLQVRERGESLLPVMLELADVAPVTVRRPVRGLLWISGRLRVLPLRVARRAALRIAAEHPDERLLDVGHGETLLRLEPAMVVLSDAEGTEALAPTAMAAAPPDPVATTGDAWLAHLAAAHAGTLSALVPRLPPHLRRAGHRIAPLGVDRLGLRLRVEGDDPARGDHDVRLPFAASLSCPGQLGAAVRALIGWEREDERGMRPTTRPIPPHAMGA